MFVVTHVLVRIVSICAGAAQAFGSRESVCCGSIVTTRFIMLRYIINIPCALFFFSFGTNGITGV
jgi:hypothetical protein